MKKAVKVGGNCSRDASRRFRHGHISGNITRTGGSYTVYVSVDPHCIIVSRLEAIASRLEAMAIKESKIIIFWLSFGLAKVVICDVVRPKVVLRHQFIGFERQHAAPPPETNIFALP